MSDTDKEFQKAMSDLGIASNYLGDGQYGGIYGKTCYKLWQACQHLNDKRNNEWESALNAALEEKAQAKQDEATANKRIADLLGLVAKKDVLIRQCIEENGYLADGDNCTLKPIIDALVLTVDDVELVEVGKVQEVGGSLFASQYSPNNGVKVGDMLHVIKQKGKINE